MKRILLIDDDPDHAILLGLAAEDIGGMLVGRLTDVELLRQEIDRLAPDLIVLDVWLDDGTTLDHLDTIREQAGEVPIVIWTHDPWVVRQYPQAQGMVVVDKLARREMLLAQLIEA